MWRNEGARDITDLEVCQRQQNINWGGSICIHWSNLAGSFRIQEIGLDYTHNQQPTPVSGEEFAGIQCPNITFAKTFCGNKLFGNFTGE